MYSCNATDSKQPAEDVDCESNPVLADGIFLEAELDGKEINNLRVEIRRLGVVNLDPAQLIGLDIDDGLDLRFSSVLKFDDTTCQDGFSFVFAKKSIMSFDVWNLRCNNWKMTGFVMAGSIEVLRQPAASQGIRCDEFQSADVDHGILGERGVKGHWALTGESIRAIDDGLTLLFVGKGLGGLKNVAEALGLLAMGLLDVRDDYNETILDPLLEFRSNGWNETILKETILTGTERSCFVGGGLHSVTIEEANMQPPVQAMTESMTDGLQEVFSFATFTWVTETTRYTSGFTVADPRDDAAAVLAWISIVILGLCCLLFVFLVCVIVAHRTIGFLTEDLSMYEQLAALMTVSAELAIISGSGGAAVPAAAALILAFVHGCGLLLYVSVSLRKPGVK